MTTKATGKSSSRTTYNSAGSKASSLNKQAQAAATEMAAGTRSYPQTYNPETSHEALQSALIPIAEALQNSAKSGS